MNHSPTKQNNIIIAVITAMVILLLLIYASVDPENEVWGKFFPKCPVKLLTGLQCPACGIQRAAFALLHGDILGALRQNWFLILSVGYLACLLITKYFCTLFSPVRKFFWGRPGCTIFIILYVLWFIIRNILHI